MNVSTQHSASTSNEQQQKEIKIYGMTAAEVREEFGNSITAKFCGMEMVVMSILSDCQELLAMAGERDGTREHVRQAMNIAKLLLSDLHIENQKRLHKEKYLLP